jgi:hypothetical protein
MPLDASQVARIETEPGELPETMAAWVIREERFGEPRDAFQIEEIEVPEPGAMEVVVRVMAAGVNYNNVWAALGEPVSVFRYHPEDHHIGGSDASGVVWKVGPGVTRWQPGDVRRLPPAPKLRSRRPSARSRATAIRGAVFCVPEDPAARIRPSPWSTSARAVSDDPRPPSTVARPSPEKARSRLPSRRKRAKAKSSSVRERLPVPLPATRIFPSRCTATAKASSSP